MEAQRHMIGSPSEGKKRSRGANPRWLLGFATIWRGESRIQWAERWLRAPPQVVWKCRKRWGGRQTEYYEDGVNLCPLLIADKDSEEKWFGRKRRAGGDGKL